MEIFSRSGGLSESRTLTIIGRKLESGMYSRFHIDGYIEISEGGNLSFETVTDELAPDNISHADFLSACEMAWNDTLKTSSR